MVCVPCANVLCCGWVTRVVVAVLCFALLVGVVCVCVCSIGNAWTKSTEFKHADGRIVVGAAAAHHLDTDTNAAATDVEH